MCGIVGYIGTEQAAPVLLDGLDKLEYRGYDSAGLAVFDGREIQIAKARGRLKVLREATHGGAKLPGNCGIGHTRWATHGIPSDKNAHPHFNTDQSIAVVHNGIIENYLKLKNMLAERGYKFVSETDTEVVAHLLDYYYKGDPLEAVTRMMHRVEGSYALGIIFKDQPGRLYAVRKDSPLIAGASKDGCLIASDVPAILKYTRDVYFIQNEEIVCMEEDRLTFFNIDGEEIAKEPVTIQWDVSAAEKAGYEHFMLKEIYEQPKAVLDTLNPRIRDGQIQIDELGMTDDEIRAIKKIYIVACGSAYHTGMTAKYVFEGLARIPVEVDLASEFRYRGDACHCSQSVGRDGRYACGTARGEKVRRARARHCQCRRKLDCARGGQCDVHLGGTGDRGRDDEGVQHTAHRRVPARDEVRAGARDGHAGGDHGDDRRSEAASGADRDAA